MVKAACQTFGSTPTGTWSAIQCVSLCVCACVSRALVLNDLIESQRLRCSLQSHKRPCVLLINPTLAGRQGHRHSRCACARERSSSCAGSRHPHVNMGALDLCEHACTHVVRVCVGTFRAHCPPLYHHYTLPAQQWQVHWLADSQHNLNLLPRGQHEADVGGTMSLSVCRPSSMPGRHQGIHIVDIHTQDFQNRAYCLREFSCNTRQDIGTIGSNTGSLLPWGPWGVQRACCTPCGVRRLASRLLVATWRMASVGSVGTTTGGCSGHVVAG